jgi:DNA modification methylase
VNEKANEVQIKPAKGRPMLTWVGKRPLRNIIAYPAQLIEIYGTGNEKSSPSPELWEDWPDAYPKSGLLFHGDNKDVLANLLANGFRGKVNLIYIDPPFDSGADYVRRLTLRGNTGSAKIEGESYSLGEQIQYTDIWANDNYLQFMYERLLLLKELLADYGNFWLHCDSQRGHYLKCILDEVFGSEHFINQVVWKRSDAHSDIGQGAKHLGAIHDMLFLYSKSFEYIWNDSFLDLPESTKEKWYRNIEPTTGRRYNKADATAPGGLNKGNPVYEWHGVTKPWRFSKEKMQELDRQGRLIYSNSGMTYVKRYLDDSKGIPLQDWWDDIQMVRGIQRRGEAQYPTEKPEQLLERILKISSRPGDIVLDCFIGSGSTAAVAQKLGRRWIGCDINKGAIQTTSKRLSDIIKEQTIAQKAATTPNFLPKDKERTEHPSPAQLSFSVYRVNDYDLQIQHNEAVNLACEHIGITRMKTDAFFDGVLGKKLVKIAPFNHPLSPVDLEEIKSELKNRPEEGRDIVVVSLGKELAVDAWLEDWNRLRKQGDFPNKIEVIELRSDPRYGGFFTHTPAQAKINVQRTEKGIEVTIESFISPTIIERLKQQAGILAPQIDDWRAMVDSVMIDPAYNGEVFNVVLADVPEKKSDLVAGKYFLPAPEGETTVAVKITDMLGEEVLITKTI